MTVRESYEKMGANYDGVLSRLGNEMLIKKFAVKIPQRPKFPGSYRCNRAGGRRTRIPCCTYTERHMFEPWL